MKMMLQHAHLEHEISGVLTSINELLPELAARPGIQVRVLSTNAATAMEQISAVRWADAVMLNSNCLVMAIAGRLLFKRTLLKLHYPQYQTVHWEFVPMSFGRRIATELRHLLRLRSSVRYKAESIGRLLVRTLVALLVDRVSACSNYCAEQSSLPRRVVLLRNPIRVVADLPPRKPSMLDCPYRFVFVGRVTGEKGWDTLVEAARIVASTNREFGVDVVGMGDAIDAMKEQVAGLGMIDRFRFLGRLDPPSTRGVLVGALGVVVPSRYQEAASYVPLEAASQRVASIVARVGGLPETAGPDCPSFSAGSAFELSELMTRFLDDPSHALAAGHAAYTRAIEHFSPKVVVDDLLRLLGPSRT
jgi:glycogen(starch) synthase